MCAAATTAPGGAAIGEKRSTIFGRCSADTSRRSTLFHAQPPWNRDEERRNTARKLLRFSSER
jgi:hypothetical protein